MKGFTVKLTRVLLSQLGDVFFVENVLLGGHPVLQQQHEQDGEGDEHKELKSRSDKRHGSHETKKKKQKTATGHRATRVQTQTNSWTNHSFWSRDGDGGLLNQSHAVFVFQAWLFWGCQTLIKYEKSVFIKSHIFFNINFVKCNLYNLHYI